MIDIVFLGKFINETVPFDTEPGFQAVWFIVNPRVNHFTIPAGYMPAKSAFFFNKKDVFILAA